MAVAENYARIVVSLPWHDKVCDIAEKDRASAFGLYVASVCFCQKNLTDGRIRRVELGNVFPTKNAGRLADLLVSVGLFDADERAYIVHDYLEFNNSRDRVIEIREQRASAGRSGGLAKAKQTASKSQAKVYPENIVHRTETEIEHQKTEELSTGYRPKCFIDADVELIRSALVAKYGNENHLHSVLETLSGTCAAQCSGLHTCGVEVALQAITRTRLPSKLPEFIRQERGRA